MAAGRLRAVVVAVHLLAGCAAAPPPARLGQEVLRIKTWGLLTYTAPCNLDMLGMLPQSPGSAAFSMLPNEDIMGLSMAPPKGMAEDAFRQVLTNRVGQRIMDERQPDHLKLLAEGMGAQLLAGDALVNSVTYRFLPTLGTTWCTAAGARPVDLNQDPGAMTLVARELGADGLIQVRFTGFRVFRPHQQLPIGEATMELVLWDAHGRVLAAKTYGPFLTTEDLALKPGELVRELMDLPDTNSAVRLVTSAMEQGIQAFIQEWAQSR